MDQKKIGCFIAQLRKEKNMTQTGLGEKLGVTNKTISRWETGNYMPDLSIIQSLCIELDISVNEFLSGERLDNDVFRQQAENNVISMLNYDKMLKKHKKLSDFFGGAGTGLLVSAIYSPDTLRKSVIIGIGITMILVGWYCRSRLDKLFFDH